MRGSRRGSRAGRTSLDLCKYWSRRWPTSASLELCEEWRRQRLSELVAATNEEEKARLYIELCKDWVPPPDEGWAVVAVMLQIELHARMNQYRKLLPPQYINAMLVKILDIFLVDVNRASKIMGVMEENRLSSIKALKSLKERWWPVNEIGDEHAEMRYNELCALLVALNTEIVELNPDSPRLRVVLKQVEVEIGKQ